MDVNRDCLYQRLCQWNGQLLFRYTSCSWSHDLLPELWCNWSFISNGQQQCKSRARRFCLDNARMVRVRDSLKKKKAFPLINSTSSASRLPFFTSLFISPHSHWMVTSRAAREPSPQPRALWATAAMASTTWASSMRLSRSFQMQGIKLVRACERVWERESVCVWERERERLCVCVCVCVERELEGMKTNWDVWKQIEML